MAGSTKLKSKEVSSRWCCDISCVHYAMCCLVFRLVLRESLSSVKFRLT